MKMRMKMKMMVLEFVFPLKQNAPLAAGRGLTRRTSRRRLEQLAPHPRPSGAFRAASAAARLAACRSPRLCVLLQVAPPRQLQFAPWLVAPHGGPPHQRQFAPPRPGGSRHLAARAT